MIEDIIPKFPENQHHILTYAAQHWRLPFWDWASKKKVIDTSEYDYDVPQLVRLELVKIRTPEGWNWVKNPLYVFRMPKNATMGDAGVKPVCIGLENNGEPKYVKVGKQFSRQTVADSFRFKQPQPPADIHQPTTLSRHFPRPSLMDTKTMTAS